MYRCILLIAALCQLAISALSQGIWTNLNVSGISANQIVAIPTDSVIYFIGSNRNFYKWNPTAGLVTTLTSHPTASNFALQPGHFTYTDEGHVYVGSNSSGTFYRYNTATNNWTQRAYPSLGTGEIVFAQSDTYFYAFNYGTGQVQRYLPESNSWQSVSISGGFSTDCHVIRGLPDGFECWDFAFETRYRYYEDQPMIEATNLEVFPAQFTQPDNSIVWPWVLQGDRLYAATSTGAAPFLLFGGLRDYHIPDNLLRHPTGLNFRDIFLWNDQLHAITNNSIHIYSPGCNVQATPTFIAPAQAVAGTPMILDFSVSITGPTIDAFSYSLSANGVLVDTQPGNFGFNNFVMPNEEVELVLTITNDWCTFSSTSSISLPGSIDGAWSQTALFPPQSAPRGEAIAVALDDYLLSGLGRTWLTTGDQLSDLYAMDYTTRRITPLGDFPGGPRRLASSFAWNNKAFVIGGYGTSGALTDAWMFDPSTSEWTALPPVPQPLADGVQWVIGNTAYVGLGTAADVYALDLNTLVWSGPIDFPATTRTGAVAFTFNGQGYVGLGTQQGNIRNDFYQFNPLTQEFTSLGAPAGSPQAMTGVAAFVFGSYVLVGYGRHNNVQFGGMLIDMASYAAYPGPSANNQWKFRPSFCQRGDRAYLLFGEESELFETGIYDLEELAQGLESAMLMADKTNPYASFGKVVSEWHVDHCSQIEANGLPDFAAALGIPVGESLLNSEYLPFPDGSMYFSVNGNDYIPSGGEWPDITLTEPGEVEWLRIMTGSGCADTLHVWFDATCTPGRTLDTPVPMAGAVQRFATSIQAGGTGFMGLGMNASDQFVNHWWALDLATGAWTPRADFPGEGRTMAAVFAVADKIYVAGGYGAESPYLNDVWEYDVPSDTWALRAALPITGLRGACAFTHAGKGYIAGGKSGMSNFFTNLMQYTPGTNTWNTLTLLGGGIKLEYSDAVVMSNAIRIVGGSGNFSPISYTITLDNWAISGGELNVHNTSGTFAITDSGNDPESSVLSQSVAVGDRLFSSRNGNLFTAHIDTLEWRHLGSWFNGIPPLPYNFLGAEALFVQDDELVAVLQCRNFDGAVTYTYRTVRIPLGDPDCPIGMDYSCLADLNGDGWVTVLDIMALVAGYGCPECNEDVNGDGLVTVSDLMAMLAALGGTCP